MEISINKEDIVQPTFRFENTRHKLGVRIWGDRKSFRALYEMLGNCWNCKDIDMSRLEGCSYIGVISYFSYEIRHAFMGNRIVLLDGKPVKEWSDGMFQLFEQEMERFEIGMELTWPHILFIMASWLECLRHQDCPVHVISVIREFIDNIEQLLLKMSRTQYPKIEPYLHGAIFAANPYLMHFMERINYDYLRWSNFSRVSLSTLADEMKCAAYGTYQYDNHMSTLKRHAKRLNCQIEELSVQVDDSVYDIEL